MNGYRHRTASRRDQMSIQVLGAGLGRTGTLSLKAVLEELGVASCYHALEVFASLDQARIWNAAARGRAGRLGLALRRLPGDRRFARLRVLSRAAREVPRGEGHPDGARSRALVGQRAPDHPPPRQHVAEVDRPAAQSPAARLPTDARPAQGPDV